MSLLGKIFGKDDVIKKSVDAIYNGVDAAVFTPEEKAKHLINLLKAYEPYKLIQRALATMVTTTYLTIWVLSALIYIASIFLDPCIPDSTCKLNQVQEVAKMLSQYNNDTLGLPFATIMALYFGGGVVNSIKEYRK